MYIPFFLELIIFCLSLFIMEINDRFKKVIFKKLYNDLSHVEIIPYEKSIWFVGRNNKYWYLELKYNGHLWWRLNFFQQFFQAFSLDRIDYEPIIAEWVEEVLNYKVVTTTISGAACDPQVEEVLNYKVVTTKLDEDLVTYAVEDVLNHKVNTIIDGPRIAESKVEEVLNHKVNTIGVTTRVITGKVEEVLNHKVNTISHISRSVMNVVEKVLNSK